MLIGIILIAIDVEFKLALNNSKIQLIHGSLSKGILKKLVTKYLNPQFL
jgi:hypothetical protein